MAAVETQEWDGLQVERIGSVGRIRLHRPRVINATTLPMLQGIDASLRAWRDDDAVTVVVIDGAGERGFCAGGDIKDVRASMLGDGTAILALWRLEYGVDYAIATYPKPVVTVVHGVTMGAGVGLGCHGRHRVASPSSRIGMPEVRIGMSPDVGGNHILSRMPGRLGEHFALTAAVACGADAVHLGFADRLVRDEVRSDLAERIAEVGLEDALAYGTMELEPCTWDAQRDWIDRCYAAEDVPGILARLDLEPGPEAAATAAAIREMPPLSLAVALRAVREARSLTLAEVLRADLRIMTRCVGATDPKEGILARVVDKSHVPQWDPPTHEDVTAELVDRHFAPLPDDLQL